MVWSPDDVVWETGDVIKFSPGAVHDKLSGHYPDKVLGWVRDAKWSSPEDVPLKQIDMARRPGGRDMKKVRGMARAIKDGKKMDPIFLVETPGDGPYVIADGYHRALAHQHAGKPTISAHVGVVDDEDGPWDRAMHDAKLNKVGPKGYEHNWVFVGVPGAGGRVFHPHHGHGTVNEHRGDSVSVHFDSGHKADFAAGHGHGEPKLQPRPEHFDDSSFSTAPNWKRVEIRGGKPGKMVYQAGQRVPEGLPTELVTETRRMTFGGIHSRVSKILRSGRVPTDDDTTTMNTGTIAEYPVSLGDVVRKMDQAIERGQLSEDTELWRTMQLTGTEVGEFVPGFEYGDLAYTSTAMQRSGAQLVADAKHKHQKKTGTLDPGKQWAMFRILARKGQHVTYADTHNKIREIILPRGSKFRVVDVAQDGTISVVLS
jgi:hypothetical protein